MSTSTLRYRSLQYSPVHSPSLQPGGGRGQVGSLGLPTFEAWHFKSLGGLGAGRGKVGSLGEGTRGSRGEGQSLGLSVGPPMYKFGPLFHCSSHYFSQAAAGNLQRHFRPLRLWRPVAEANSARCVELRHLQCLQKVSVLWATRDLGGQKQGQVDDCASQCLPFAILRAVCETRGKKFT